MTRWGLVPPLRSAKCQHCAMQTRVETRYRVVGVSLFVPAAVSTSPSLHAVTYFLT